MTELRGEFNKILRDAFSDVERHGNTHVSEDYYTLKLIAKVKTHVGIAITEMKKAIMEGLE